ncbi:hypothetical protein STENM36S_01648 [Streptomyces tendae]
MKDASLYTHVRNLQDLRVRVALLAGGELIEEIAGAVAGRAGKEALAAFAGAYRAYALRHPGRYAATQIRVDQSLVTGSPALRRTAEITHGMLRAYGLAEPDLTDAVRLLRSTFHGYCAWRPPAASAPRRGRAGVLGQGGRRPARGPGELAARLGQSGRAAVSSVRVPRRTWVSYRPVTGPPGCRRPSPGLRPAPAGRAASRG